MDFLSFPFAADVSLGTDASWNAVTSLDAGAALGAVHLLGLFMLTVACKIALDGRAPSVVWSAMIIGWYLVLLDAAFSFADRSLGRVGFHSLNGASAWEVLDAAIGWNWFLPPLLIGASMTLVGWQRLKTCSLVFKCLIVSAAVASADVLFVLISAAAIREYAGA
ncbi:MAG: hypothetical protein N2C14_12840 [Planctomycetales bacterium]